MAYDNINLRIIKPYKQLYNILISIILTFGIDNLGTLNQTDYVDAVQHKISTIWKPILKQPVEAFYECCRGIAIKRNKQGLPEFFQLVNCKMMQLWDTEIVQQSNNFKKAKVEQ